MLERRLFIAALKGLGAQTGQGVIEADFWDLVARSQSFREVN